MNEIINKFSLAADKFMPEMHLRQPGSTYTVCGPFIKSKERMQKFNETRDARFIYQKNLDKACFHHDMAYRDFKDLHRKNFSDEVLPDKTFKIAKNPKYNIYQQRLANRVYELFDKMFAATRKGQELF